MEVGVAHIQAFSNVFPAKKDELLNLFKKQFIPPRPAVYCGTHQIIDNKKAPIVSSSNPFQADDCYELVNDVPEQKVEMDQLDTSRAIPLSISIQSLKKNTSPSVVFYSNLNDLIKRKIAHIGKIQANEESGIQHQRLEATSSSAWFSVPNFEVDGPPAKNEFSSPLPGHFVSTVVYTAQLLETFGKSILYNATEVLPYEGKDYRFTSWHHPFIGFLVGHNQYKFFQIGKQKGLPASIFAFPVELFEQIVEIFYREHLEATFAFDLKKVEFCARTAVDEVTKEVPIQLDMQMLWIFTLPFKPTQTMYKAEDIVFHNASTAELQIDDLLSAPTEFEFILKSQAPSEQTQL